MYIKTQQTVLTDSSKVYDVVIQKDGTLIRLHACSKEDAWWLEEKLSAAIGEHAVEDVQRF